MSDTVPPPSHSSTPSRLSGGSGGDGAVRVRSHHHRHRSHHAFRAESDAEARRSLNLHVLFWVLPLAVLASGVLLLAIATHEPDPSLRPRGLVELAQELLGFGGLLTLLALVFAGWRAARLAREERRRRHGERHHSHRAS